MNATLGPFLVLAGLASAAPAAADPFRILTDADLVAYAAEPFDAAALSGKRVVIGLHNGLPVIADFPCDAPCPAGTSRVIHYEIGPGAPCAAAGGVTVTRPQTFHGDEVETQICAPKALVGR